jgi:hypothetical protein
MRTSRYSGVPVAYNCLIYVAARVPLPQAAGPRISRSAVACGQFILCISKHLGPIKPGREAPHQETAIAGNKAPALIRSPSLANVHQNDIPKAKTTKTL